jgi:hypothetical protein
MYITKQKLVIIGYIILIIFSILGINYIITKKFVEPLDTKTTADKTKYDTNNYNVQYHDSIDDLNSQKGIYDLSFGSMVVLDKSGNKVAIPYVKGQALPTYYQPGSFIFGSSNYVPNYEDSVYLSRTTGLTTLSTIYPTSSMLGGFCTQNSNDPTALEKKCNSLSNDTCASTSCCILLGGSKCVSGNENGPIMKANYTDSSIKNKEVYYYQGKCYGNCL